MLFTNTLNVVKQEEWNAHKNADYVQNSFSPVSSMYLPHFGHVFPSHRLILSLPQFKQSLSIRVLKEGAALPMIPPNTNG
jgi:hypothetical protein